MFDMLLLLSEGRTMYLGPSADAVTYFSHVGFDIPPLFNPADFYLDLIAMVGWHFTGKQISAQQLML